MHSLQKGNVFFKSRRSTFFKEKFMEILFKVGEKEVDELALSVGGENFNNVSVFDAPQ